MAKKIQGITITIDGDTTGLDNALKDLQAQAKLVDRDLQNVNKALKLNPGDTEQTARKLELLAEKAELSEKKIAALKEAQAKLDASGVDKASKGYQDLTTELSKAESELRALSTEMDRTKTSSNEVVEGQKMLETYLSATGKTADQLVTIIGAKLVDAYKSGQLGAAGYERALELITKESTGSKDNLEALKKVLSSVGDGASFESVNNQLTALSNATKGSEEEVRALSARFTELEADTNGLDTRLNAVNEALKFDPTSLEAITQKQALLAQAVDASKEKVSLLKSEYANISPEDVGAEKFSALEQEIAAAGEKLNAYEVELSGANVKAAELEGGLTGLSNSLLSVNERLQFDGSGIDSLREKESLLTEAVNQTEIRLESLRAELSGINPDTDLGREKFVALETEINLTENELTGYKAELTSVTTECESLAQNQNRLDTFFKATRTSVNDYANVLGSDLVAALENGKASSNELERAISLIATAATGSRGDVDKLKAALDSVDSGADLGTVRAEIEKLGSEADTASNKFGELGEQLNTAFSGINEQLESLNEKQGFSNLVEGLGAVKEGAEQVGDAFGGLLNDSLDASETVQESQSTIQVSLGTTKEQAEELQKAAADIYGQGFADSVDDATERLVKVGQTFDGLSTKDLSNLTIQFSTLEKAGLDYEESIRAVDNMTKSFGIDSEQAFDLLITGAQNGLNKSDELSDNIAEYAPRWADAGVSADNYFSLLQAGSENASYNLDKVGDFLNEFLTSLSDGRIEENLGSLSSGTQAVFESWKSGGANAQDVLNAVIGDISNMSSETDKAALASTLWSSLGEDNSLKMIEALGGVENKYSDIAGATDTAVESNSNSATELKNKWETLKTEALAPLGEKLAEVGIAILEKLIPPIEAVVNWFTNLSPEMQNVILIIGGLIAAIGPITGIITSILAICNPIGGIIAAIAAGITGLVLVITNWGNICEWFKGVWEGLCNFLGPIWQGICDGISGAWNGIWGSIQGAWEGVTGWFGSAFEGVKSTCSGIWNDFANGCTDTWNKFSEGCKSTWDSTKSWLGEKFNDCKNAITGTWDNLCTNVDNSLKSTGENIQSTWNSAKDGLGSITQALSEDLSGKEAKIKSNTENCWSDLEKVVSNRSQGMSEESRQQLANIEDSMQSSWNAACNDTNVSWEDIESQVRAKSSGANEDVRAATDEMLSVMKQNYDHMHSETDSKWGSIKTLLQEKAQGALDYIEEHFGISRQQLIDTWEGLKGAFEEKWNQIKNVFSRAWNWIDNNVLRPFREAWQGLVDMVSGIGSSIGGAVDTVKGWLGINYSVEAPAFKVAEVPTQWFAKGGILTKPTIFGQNGATYLGGGEAGKEAVLPIETLKSYIREEVNSNDVVGRLDTLISLFENFGNMKIVMDTGQTVGALAGPMDTAIGKRAQKARRR